MIGSRSRRLGVPSERGLQASVVGRPSEPDPDSDDYEGAERQSGKKEPDHKCGEGYRIHSSKRQHLLSLTQRRPGRNGRLSFEWCAQRVAS